MLIIIIPLFMVVMTLYNNMHSSLRKSPELLNLNVDRLLIKVSQFTSTDYYSSKIEGSKSRHKMHQRAHEGSVEMNLEKHE